MNGGQRQRYVPHVGRATTTLLCFAVWENTAKRLGIAAVEGRYGRVMLHLRIGRTAPKDLQLRPGGECPGFKATQDFGTDLVEVIDRLGTHHVSCRRLRWDNIWCITPLGDNTVHAIGGTNVLTQQPNGDLRDSQCVCSIDPQ